jgi:AraC family transcriptional regulator, regulatory protein of adaptative response / methylated-DNA-[protein]-cysteine methyltransferase
MARAKEIGTKEKPHSAQPLTDEIKWTAVAARDKTHDGVFYYSVETTGVYCRPSCPARLAKRSNVRFHATCSRAEQAGFRACKRCKPNDPSLDQQQAARIAAACRRIENAEDMPSLAVLAKTAGLSPFHFNRIFKAAVGVTPKAYALAQRGKRVRENLAASRTVTHAIYEAGFNSSGRFYATSGQLLGMTSKAYRSGGKDTEIHFAVAECTLGSILVAQSPIGVCAILMGDDPGALVRDLQDRFPKAGLIGGDKKFEKLVAKVIGFVEAPRKGLDLPLDIRGTAFQHRVWEALRRIPPGSTASYTEIAGQIGNPNAVRAVARACAANALAVVIPCHRVVRNDGNLSGYRWGVERKRALLDKEAK